MCFFVKEVKTIHQSLTAQEVLSFFYIALIYIGYLGEKILY